jgi:ATP-dependent HslUV protease, peptidase subunit HslV
LDNFGFHATTILCLRLRGKTAIAGDGQVSYGDMVLKGKATKLRQLNDGKIVAGFAGATADAFALFDKFETFLDANEGDLTRSVVELAKEWRLDKMMNRLDALLLVADSKNIYMVSGIGDIIEPDDNVLAIGSGGPYALSAARALIKHSKLNAEEVALESMKIAADICIYTNHQITVMPLEN